MAMTLHVTSPELFLYRVVGLQYYDGTIREWRNLGPGGNDGILHFHGELPTLIELYGKCVQRHKGGCSFDVVDLVLLEEKLGALCETFHSIILGLECL